ncbi:MAG: TetR/AcrR family transcriptional regulator [Flavobacteriaceae bacterium]|uniref:TetR/AcrR family transcriptional regulator n=1 Tax=Flavobacterium sp. Leaf359 TaxID=1736351 RepID=UPI0006FDDD97|nr:TetR/AcrR family transcriptional regulator [Flavobacterium sp. Leaf359]KQS53409.1 TetR family transcriptional regulator [Flavobacterium sp. Leaf359]PZO28221.1 MAG: TetR/AcrR family transcriptional regulator [Flavobacteriaceae bacterium]
MKRKAVAGNIRNKERSKEKFLEAVGKILETKGYSGLKVNDIAATAGVDKKMIYNYFGGTDKLIDEYISSLDFWSNVDGNTAPEIADGGQEFSKQLLTQQFDYVASNKNLQKILLWGVAEKRNSLRNIADERERNGERLFNQIADPYFAENALQYRAIMAILISGIYYLNLYKGVNAETFCGIDLTKNEGSQQIKGALGKIIDLVYEDHNKEN